MRIASLKTEHKKPAKNITIRLLSIIVVIAVLAGPFIFSSPVSAADANKLELIVTPATVKAGDPVTLTVTAKDGDSTVTDYIGTVHFTSSDPDPEVSLPADYTFISGENSTHEFTATLKTAGDRTITVTDIDNQQLTDTKPVQVLAAVEPPQVVTLDASNITSTGVQLNGRLDSLGSAGSVTVSFEWGTTTSYGHTINGTIPSMTNTGAFTAGLTGLTANTTYHFRAIAAGDGDPQPGDDQPFTTTEDNSEALVFITDSQNITAGSVSGEITVQLQDGTGNPLNAGSDISITLTSSSADGRIDTSPTGLFDGSITGITMPGGSSQTSFYYRDTRAGRPEITASAAAYENISQIETVNAAGATQILVETDTTETVSLVPAQNINTGGALTVYAVARDQYNNFVDNRAGTWTLTNLTGEVADTDLAASNDGLSAVFTGHLAGSAFIHVTVGELTSVDSGVITVVSTGVSRIVVSGFRNPTKPGEVGNFNVTVQTAGGNTDTSYTGTVHFTSSDPKAALPEDYTFVSGDNGAHQFTATLKTRGTQSITATDITQAGLSGTQSNITVKAASSGGGGSGGGGGGGGGIVTPPALQTTGLVTSFPATLDAYGITKTAAQYKTGDSRLTLDIAANTKLTNSYGSALTILSAVPLSSPPAPPAGNNLILAYELGPEGATFAPALTLTFSYGTLPEGTRNISLAYWNGTAWQAVAANVDTAKGTVTAQISHFSKYALVYQLPSPANIAFTGITVSPQTVNPDEKVTIQATVTNSGDLSGSYKLTLKVNDRQVDLKEVTVAGGKTETVSFEVQRGMEGEYSVDVNGKTGKFTIEAPPPGTVSELTPTKEPDKVIVPATAGSTPWKSPTLAAPRTTTPASVIATSAPETEEKPTPPFLWPLVYMAAVSAVLTMVFLYQYKWRNRKIR